MTPPTFSVSGQRVVVVGAARSGVAAAHLLVARGASVVLTDTRETIDPADELRRAGVVLELGGHRVETLKSADLIVLSPGVSPRQVDVAGGFGARVPVLL
jgi:UDP-N-acetylmuramoylalanine--D-glutamate ligase